jgi:type III secretion protein J
MMLKLKPIRINLALFFLLGVVACQSQQILVSELTEREANEILVVLQSQKLEPVKVAVPGRTVTYTVSVKEKSAPEALRILVENKLPRPVSQGLADVYPVGGGGLIPTASEEKAKFVMAIQGEIENMLKVLPGIIETRVVIVLADTDAIRDINTPPPPATASVAIVYNPIDNQGTPSVTPDDVKYLISSAVEDLSPASVTVVMASNVPMKLIDVSRNIPKKAVAKPTAAVSTESATPPSSSGNAISSSGDSVSSSAHHRSDHLAFSSSIKAKEEEDSKGRFLVWLFGALAVLGLMLGTFGLMRAVSLRSKIANMQNKIDGNVSKMTPEIVAEVMPKPPEAGSTPGA